MSTIDEIQLRETLDACLALSTLADPPLVSSTADGDTLEQAMKESGLTTNGEKPVYQRQFGVPYGDLRLSDDDDDDDFTASANKNKKKKPSKKSHKKSHRKSEKKADKKTGKRGRPRKQPVVSDTTSRSSTTSSSTSHTSGSSSATAGDSSGFLPSTDSQIEEARQLWMEAAATGPTSLGGSGGGGSPLPAPPPAKKAKLVTTDDLRALNEEQLERLEKVEKERDELARRYKVLEQRYNQMNKRDQIFQDLCNDRALLFNSYSDIDHRLQKHEQPPKDFGNHRVYAGDLSITINVFGKVVCVNIRKFSSGGKIQQAVTLNPEEFLWLTGGVVNHPREGKNSRVQCVKQSTGGWLLSRIDPCKNQPTIPRCVHINMWCYQKLFAKKPVVLEKIRLAEEHLNFCDNLTMHREMVVMVGQIYYSFETVDKVAHNRPPNREEMAETSLGLVKLGLIKAIFAGCGEAIPKAETIDDLIGDHREAILKEISEGPHPQRAQALFTSYMDLTRGAVETYAWMATHYA